MLSLIWLIRLARQPSSARQTVARSGTPAGPLGPEVQDLCNKYRPRSRGTRGAETGAFERTLRIIETVHDDGSEGHMGMDHHRATHLAIDVILMET